MRPIIRDVQVRQAKDFLVQQTAEQAVLEGIPLSDLEKRMMYFTESEDAVEDPLALNSEFEEYYETDAYETKIARLLKNAYKRLKQEHPEKALFWKSSINELHKGDHYILVLWRSHPPSEHPTRDTLLYIGIGVAIAMVFFLGVIVSTAIRGR